MPFHQRGNVAVLPTAQQIAFPMARNRSVFRLRPGERDYKNVELT
jgi:hypothetical protein